MCIRDRRKEFISRVKKARTGISRVLILPIYLTFSFLFYFWKKYNFFWLSFFQEIGEALSDLKLLCSEIRRSDTFRKLLGLLLSIGNFLNGVNVSGTVRYLTLIFLFALLLTFLTV